MKIEARTNKVETKSWFRRIGKYTYHFNYRSWTEGIYIYKRVMVCKGGSTGPIIHYFQEWFLND